MCYTTRQKVNSSTSLSLCHFSPTTHYVTALCKRACCCVLRCAAQDSVVQQDRGWHTPELHPSTLTANMPPVKLDTSGEPPPSYLCILNYIDERLVSGFTAQWLMGPTCTWTSHSTAAVTSRSVCLYIFIKQLTVQFIISGWSWKGGVHVVQDVLPASLLPCQVSFRRQVFSDVDKTVCKSQSVLFIHPSITYHSLPEELFAVCAATIHYSKCSFMQATPTYDLSHIISQRTQL